MTDKELFIKYNLISNNGETKSQEQEIQLYNNKISCNEPSIIHRKILLLLHASYRCNLNCIYCENGSLREEYKTAIMSENMVRDIVRKLGPFLREVTWHGGEPLILSDNLILALEEEKKKYNYDFIFSSVNNTPLVCNVVIKS